MFLPLFIARRMGGSSKGSSQRVMGRIAKVSVAISVAVMLVSVAIVEGFRNEISRNITAVEADIQLHGIDTVDSKQVVPITISELTLSRLSAVNGVQRVYPIITSEVVLQGDSALVGAHIKGVDSRFSWDFFRDKLVEGLIPTYSDSVGSREVLLSQTMARQVGAQVGSVVNLIFVEQQGSPERVRVAGLYSTGMAEVDGLVLLAHRQTIARMLGLGPQMADGYQLQLRRGASLEQVMASIEELSWQESLIMESTQDRFPAIFGWLKMLDSNAYLVLIIMLVVAGINMVSSVLIIVLENTQTIGLLMSQGIRMGQLRWIFVFRCMPITLWGILWGVLLGLGFCFLQHSVGLIALDSEAYMVSQVPIYIDYPLVALIAVASFVLITLLSLLPAMIIARLSPDKTLRFK
ncbi:MAG: FtsX-like permease family protein [Mucinivorans sp.]